MTSFLNLSLKDDINNNKNKTTPQSVVAIGVLQQTFRKFNQYCLDWIHWRKTIKMDEPMLGGDKSGSGSVHEPLVPDEISEEFYFDLCNKLKEIQKIFKIKDIQEHVDNLERIILVCEYFQEKLAEEEKKCVGLQNNVVEANQKYVDVIELSSLDKEAINELREVIEHAWRQKDAAQLREQEAMDESTMLREKMEHMEVLLQRYMDQSRSKFNE